jgi:hypothetical protein
MSEIEPLPPGELLLHIGPFKTGTTTVQAAFHQNREALARQHIHYAGRGSQPMAAAMEAAGRETLPTLGRGPDRWSRLLEEIRAAEARHVVVSSEFFSGADDDRARSIVEALGADRTHVVVTLRPLVRILASQWQQYIQNRIVIGYDEWLHAVLDDPDAPPRVTPSFWLRHRHDRLVRRWAQAVGTDRLTVVVVDESDQRMLPRTFEQLLGLEPLQRLAVSAARCAVAAEQVVHAEPVAVGAHPPQHLANGAPVFEPVRGQHGTSVYGPATQPRRIAPAVARQPRDSGGVVTEVAQESCVASRVEVAGYA